LMFSHVGNASQIAGLPERNFVFTDQFTDLLASIRGASDEGGGGANGH